MNWPRPIERIVEMIIAVWLFDIIFRPRRIFSRENAGN